MKSSRPQGLPSLNAGTFEYRRVPTGDYELRFSGFGVTRSRRIGVEVSGDTLVVLDLPQFGENLVTFCLQGPKCAPILTRKPVAELELPEEEEPNVLGHRLALALASSAWDDEEPWFACVPDEALEGVLRALSEVYDHVVPVSECEFRDPPPDSQPGPRKRWFHAGTSRRATVIAVDGLDRESDVFVHMDVSYHVGPLWAAGWQWDVRKTNGVWFPERRWMRWIS